MDNKNEKDYTDELVKAVNPCESCIEELEECETCERQPEMRVIKSIEELENTPIELLNPEELVYLINNLKMKNREMQKVTEATFKQVNAEKEKRNKDLRLMEDTLTFIKTSVANTLGSVTLAIKNMEREVNNNGN